MSKPFDYSKWDKIELSDDEEDVHPNIDRESWFRMKHRSRVEREEHEAKDRQRILQEVSIVVYSYVVMYCIVYVMFMVLCMICECIDCLVEKKAKLEFLHPFCSSKLSPHLNVNE